MSLLVALHLALATTPAALAQDGDAERLYCVAFCQQRTITGMCLDYGPDFCTPYPETGCVEHCTQRSITQRCAQYGADFCGIAPECAPYCEDRSVTGMCLRYGQDACVSY
jgi:hypothetical protein